MKDLEPDPLLTNGSWYVSYTAYKNPNVSLSHVFVKKLLISQKPRKTYLNLEMLQKATRSQAKHQDLIPARLNTRTYATEALLYLNLLPLFNLSTKKLSWSVTVPVTGDMLWYLKNL